MGILILILLIFLLNKFIFVHTNRPRNEQEIARQELPLSPILMRNDRNEEIVPAGNPRYMVRISFLILIQLIIILIVFFLHR